MAVYNTSWMYNATNPADVIVGIGTAVGNQYLFGYMLLLSFFMVLLFYSGFRSDMREALLITSFLTTILALLLFGAGTALSYSIVPLNAVLWPLILMIISLIAYFITR